MNDTHKNLSKKILEYLKELKNTNVILLNEKIKFNVRLDERGQGVVFYIGDITLKKVAIKKIADLSLLVIKNESFKLSDLKTDVTDFEVSLIYDFLIKHEYDIHSYSGYEQSQTELLESNFKEEIYYKDMGADRNDIRSQWIKSLTDKKAQGQALHLTRCEM